MPAISIIVPVYNTEKYIRRCIDSILAQTFQDYELILINDGSTDSSPVICENFASLDSRIRLFHTINSGVSSARNFGIEQARGTFIYFCDADDVISPEAFDLFISNANKSNADIIVADHVAIYPDHVEYGPIPWCLNNKQDRLSSFFYSDNTAAWNILIRKTLLSDNNIRFNTQLSIGEDFLFLVELINTNGQFHHIKKNTYEYYHTNANSATAVWGLKQLLAKADTYKAVENYLSEKGILNLCKEAFLIKCSKGIQNLLLFEEGIDVYITTCPEKKKYIRKSMLSWKIRILSTLACNKIKLPVRAYARIRTRIKGVSNGK